MDAAEDLPLFFNAVSDNPAAAMRTFRREQMDCAFEAVEHVSLALNRHLKRFIVIVSADFALSHDR
jgi:hypothetical protein